MAEAIEIPEYEDMFDIEEDAARSGNVVSPRVILEDGGRVNGSIDMAPVADQSGRTSTSPQPAAKPHLQEASSRKEPDQSASEATAKRG